MAQDGFGGSGDTQPWYAIGAFDGSAVQVDKPELHRQLADHGNEHLDLCPLFDRNRVEQAIEALPDTLDPTDDGEHYVLLRNRVTGAPAWVVPTELRCIPCGLTASGTSDSSLLASLSPPTSTSTGLGFRIEAKLPDTSEPREPHDP